MQRSRLASFDDWKAAYPLTLATLDSMLEGANTRIDVLAKVKEAPGYTGTLSAHGDEVGLTDSLQMQRLQVAAYDDDSNGAY